MSNEYLTGTPAIAWTMYRPGEAGKDMACRIMTVDVFLITGQAPLGKTMRYTVRQYRTAEDARRAAVSATERKERAKFIMITNPQMRKAQGGKRSWLEDMVDKANPFASKGLDDSFTALLTGGTYLEEAS